MAAVLFKVDDAWKSGEVTDLACTSAPCQWNVPAFKVEPIRLKEMNICKPKALRQEQSRPLNSITKQLFGRPKRGKGMTPEQFLQELCLISPAAVTLGERSADRHQVYCEYDKLKTDLKDSTPPSIADIAADCTSVEELYAKLDEIFTPEKVKNIEANTREQGGDLWKNQRKGRLTASKFYRVHTRMTSYSVNPSINMNAVVSEVLQYKSPPSTLKALKYGRRMEDTAARKYEKVMTELGHKNLKVAKCGLFVSESVPYIGASPDRMVTCDCCGKRVLEIKCPLSCSHTAPSDKTDGLVYNNQGILGIKHKHQYYAQIQGQMALVGCDSADFFVYSLHGYHLETISFDPLFWQEISLNLSTFFKIFISEELITKSVFNSLQEPNTASTSSSSVTKPEVGGATFISARKHVEPPKKGKGRKVKQQKIRPTYTCGTCKNICKYPEEISDTSENSVMCDTCKKWYHYVCIGITEAPSDDEDYYCTKCIANIFA